MKTTHILLKLIILLCFGFIAGCSGVNEFAKYDIRNSKILFKSSAKHTASNVRINLTNPEILPGNSPIEIILTEVGENMMSSSVQEKIDKAYEPDTVSGKLSDGLMKGLLDYFNFTSVDTQGDNPDYLFETRLERFELSSGSYGMHALISAEVLIVDRKSAKTVWQNTERVSSPLKEAFYSYYPDRRVRTAVSIINAVRLMEMTEDEIRDAINFTAEELAYELTGVLRNDIAYAKE
jgi:hypothetical protein